MRITTTGFPALRLLALLGCLAGSERALAAGAAADAPSGPTARHAMVVAANPLAVQAGVDVLKAGGSAADAAVAVQAVLGLVEPQSSGIGGGTFIVYFDAAHHRVIAYNGRETAPAGATPDMFLDAQGHPLSYAEAVMSGRSTGVPGAVAALGLLQREHGKLPWKKLFARGEQLAADGFKVSPRLAGMIASSMPQASSADAVRYFSHPDGSRYVAGDVLKNVAYASTLREIATAGPEALYHGHLARDIVARVHQDPRPGTLSEADFAAYRPIEAEALCRPWGHFRVCTPPLPAGGVAVLEGLELLAQTDIGTRGPTDPIAWVELGEAERLMYADRGRYTADPAFVAVPVDGLLDPTYIHTRATLIGTRIAANAPGPGQPPGAAARGPDHTTEPGGTSHLVIADAAGNVLSMTTTVESIFGDGRMVHGFFLNNQLTDFSYSPVDPDGLPAANAVAPGKRPRSAMSPTIVLDGSGHFVAATGSAGGPAIISYILKTLVGALDWHLSMQQAIALPNLIARGAEFTAETSKFSPGLLQELAEHGLSPHPVTYEESGLQGIAARRDGTLEGGADPRREGIALGY